MVDSTGNDSPKAGQSKPLSPRKGTIHGFITPIQKRYEDLIEAVKRRVGFYNPDVSDSDRFLMSFLIYFTVLLMVVFTADYLAQLTYEDSDSLGPLQQTEVEIIYRVQKDVFDMPVQVDRSNNTIWYDTNVEWNGQKLSQNDSIGGFGLEIASVCTGFHEMVFLGVLVLGFRGVPVLLRVKWTAILLGIVFIENLFRIFALYPLALYKGREFEDWFHYYWWHYGQYAFIMCLFGLWFFFVARKYVNADEYSEAQKSKRSDDASSEEEKDEEKPGKTGEEEGSVDSQPGEKMEGMVDGQDLEPNVENNKDATIQTRAIGGEKADGQMRRGEKDGPIDGEELEQKGPGVNRKYEVSFKEIDEWWRKWFDDLNEVMKL